MAPLIANVTVPELRVPPAGAEIKRLFAGWREELATRRRFVPAGRHYAAARREADVGLPHRCVPHLRDQPDVRYRQLRPGPGR